MSRPCFKKTLSLHILAEKFLNDLFRILLENFSFYILSLKIQFLWPFFLFLVIDLSTFFRILHENFSFYHFISRNSDDLFFPFLVIDLLLGFQPPIYTLYIHTDMLFSRFYTSLLSAIVTVNIRLLFLLTSSLHKQPFITAHFVHHCTLEQTLVRCHIHFFVTSTWSRAVETHFKKPRCFRFFKKPNKPEKLGF